MTPYFRLGIWSNKGDLGKWVFKPWIQILTSANFFFLQALDFFICISGTTLILTASEWNWKEVYSFNIWKLLTNVYSFLTKKGIWQFFNQDGCLWKLIVKCIPQCLLHSSRKMSLVGLWSLDIRRGSKFILSYPPCML